MANQQQVDSVKAEVVDYAREKWPMFFSRFFKVSAVSGQHSECKQVLSGAQQCPVFGQLVNITCVFTKVLYSFHMTMKRPMKILLTVARNCAVKETLSQYQVLLSCFFPVFDLFPFLGPQLPKSNFIVAINWTGLTFLDEKERKLLSLSFPEVTGVNTIR